MPLTRKVTFKRNLQKCNMIRVPKLIRWQFKMEPEQVLRVEFTIPHTGRGWPHFYAKMEKDGRLRILKSALGEIQNEGENLVGTLLELILQPT